MPLPFHPMYLEQLKAGYLAPYDGPGLPPGEGQPAPLQPGNQYGPTPMGVMGQYPPPGNQQDPLLGSPEPMETPPPSMGGIPPNPMGDPDQLAMVEQYGEPPPIPDYAAFDAETEAMARRIQKDNFYDALIASGAGGMQAMGGTIAQTMAGMGRGLANMPAPSMTADTLRRERGRDRRDMQSGFLSDRKSYYDGVQAGQKADYIAGYDSSGGGESPWSGQGGDPFSGRSSGPSATQMFKMSAWSALREIIPPDHLPQAEALYTQGMATGDYSAYNEFSKSNGFWNQDPADLDSGLMKIGQGGIIFDSISNSYLIPSLAGNKWIRSEDISIPDPSALAQDQAMMDQVRMEISIANTIKRIVSDEATPDEVADVVEGLDPVKLAALQDIKAQFGSGGAQISPEQLHSFVYDWLDRSGYTSQLRRTGGLVLRPGAMAYKSHGDIRQMRVSPTGQRTPIATPARGVLPITGEDQGYRETGGVTFTPGSVEAMDMEVAANGGPQRQYDLLVQQGAPDGKDPATWRKRLDKVFGERYGVGPMKMKDTPSPTAHGPAQNVGHEYRGTLDPANRPAPDTLGGSERLAFESDRISAEKFSLPKRERPAMDYDISETGGFKPRDEGPGLGEAVGQFAQEAMIRPERTPEQLKKQRTSLLGDVTRGLSFTDRRRLREHLAGMSDEEAVEELKRLKEEMF